MKMKCLYSLFFIIVSFTYSQDDLEALLSPIEYSSNDLQRTFFSTRIVNSHSVDLYKPGALDLRISHRFGPLSSGIYELFGLDQATIRVGFEYGLSDKLMIGLGRSSYKKNYDGFLKYSIIEQSKNNKIPFSVVYFSSISLESIKKNQENYPFAGRLNYCNQILVASRLNSKISFQFIPTFIHKNMVEKNSYNNNLYLMGFGIRYKLSSLIAINAEYHYLLNNNINQTYNSFSIGIDIETGGHIFQLHCTNSLSMYEVGFLTETNESWLNGGIHFGFNISREFILK
ncbi:MAG: hypothetical protein CBC73_04845 [Flavobacteriales bacterium TMED113]|nr:MAG: hypothetical protein CBC73_04845 [Flavobacteriales bacterium TMED113]